MTFISTSIAVLLGVAIPSLFLGRAVLAVVVGVSLILILVDLPFDRIKRDFKSVGFHPLGLCLIAVFLLSLPGVISSDLFSRSFVALARTFLFCCYGILVWSYLRTKPERVSLVLKSFVISAAISSGLAFISQYLLPELYWFIHLKGWKSESLYLSLKGFSAIVVFVIPLLFLVIARIKGTFSIVAILTGCSFLLLILNLANRSAMAGLLALLVCVGIVAGTRSRNKLQLIVGAGLVVSCLASILVWLRLTRDYSINEAPEADYFLPVWLLDFERQTIWQHAVEIGLMTPWFGRGPNSINFAPGANKHLEGTAELHVIPAHPHNWVVELFAEIGIVALSMLVIFMIVSTFRLMQGYRRSGDIAYLSAIAISAGYWASGLFNFSFWASWWQLAFILAMAISLSIPNKNKRSPQPAS